MSRPGFGFTHGPRGKGAGATSGVGNPGQPCEQCGEVRPLKWGGEFVTIDGVTRVKRLRKCALCWGEGDWPKRPEAA